MVQEGLADYLTSGQKPEKSEGVSPSAKIRNVLGVLGTARTVRMETMSEGKVEMALENLRGSGFHSGEIKSNWEGF